ncbi:MAG: DUF2393 family protein [Helicobacteraceae bacterium]|nr:DUF2393 family protein [Helicobacteraceae bacterium]
MQTYINKLISISHYFSMPDYLVLIAIFLIILLIFLISVAFRASALISFLFFFVSGVLYFGSPFIYQQIQEKDLKKIEFSLKHNQALTYDNSYFIEGSIKNIGKLDFRGCSIRVNFIPQHAKALDKIRYKIRPRYLEIKEYKTPLKKGESMEFKFTIAPPRDDIKFNLTTQGACY